MYMGLRSLMRILGRSEAIPFAILFQLIVPVKLEQIQKNSAWVPSLNVGRLPKLRALPLTHLSYVHGAFVSDKVLAQHERKYQVLYTHSIRNLTGSLANNCAPFI